MAPDRHPPEWLIPDAIQEPPFFFTWATTCDKFFGLYSRLHFPSTYNKKFYISPLLYCAFCFCTLSSPHHKGPGRTKEKKVFWHEKLRRKKQEMPFCLFPLPSLFREDSQGNFFFSSSYPIVPCRHFPAFSLLGSGGKEK